MTENPRIDVKSIFGRALELTDIQKRAAFLDEACSQAPEVRSEVEELLALHARVGGFMQSPAMRDATPTGEFTGEYEPVAEQPGALIGPYKLLQQIGEGGMGTVFMAEQTEPVRRKVALKIIKPGMDSKQVVARFEAERQALAMMDHTNIARVLDAGTTENGRPFFVMELVHGVPLVQYCDANKLTPRERLELFIPICQAIQHAHQKGIIHRDIKPSNVLVTMYDDKPVPKVIDFGVAKAIEQKLTERTLFTQYGTLVGTFEYMSPEQAEMNAFGVDTRSDVYSLGVLLYELLTGTTPLERKQLRQAALSQIVRMIREEEPPRPSVRLSTSDTLAKVAAARKTDPAKLSALVRGELDWIVMRCLEKDRSRRYDSASALAKDVRHYLADEPVEACPPSLGYRLRKVYRKNKAALLTAATIILLLIAGIAVSTRQAIRATDAEKTADDDRTVAVKAEKRAAEERDNTKEELRQRLLAEENERATQYVLDFQTLPFVWSAGNIEQARAMLNRHDEKLRGFEWHYWDRKTHAERNTFALDVPPEPQSEIGHVTNSEWVFSADGTRLALLQLPGGGGVKAVLTVWDVASRKRLLSGYQTPPGFWPFGNNIQISRNGKRVLIKQVGQVVDVDSGKAVFGPDFLMDKDLTLTSRQVGMSPDGNKRFALISSKTQPTMLKVWDLDSSKELFSSVAGKTLPVFSPDGLSIVGVAPVDGKPRTKMWEVASGKEVWQANATPPFVFSPDGRLLAGATLKSEPQGLSTLRLTVLDAETGTERSTTSVPIHWKHDPKTGTVDLREPLTFNPDGSRLAIGVTILELGGSQRRVRWFLVDPLAGGVSAILDESGFAFKSGAPEPVNPFFTPDGKVFGWTAQFGIKRLDATTGQLLETLWGHGNTVAACARTPDNRRMWSVGQNGDLKEWDLYPPEPEELSVPGFPYYSTSADGRWIARATMDELRVLDFEGKNPRTLKLRHRGDHHWVRTALSSDGKRVAILRPGDQEMGTAKPDLSVWDVERGEEVFFQILPEISTSDTFDRISLSPAGDRVAVVQGVRKGTERSLMIFDVKTGKLQQSKPFAGDVYQLAFSPDGRRLAGLMSVRSADGSVSRKLVAWDGFTGETLRDIERRPESKGLSPTMVWSPDSSRVAVSGADNDQVHIHFYDVSTGQVTMVLDKLSRFSAISTQTIDLAFSLDGRRLAVYVPRPKVVKIYDTSNGKELLALPVTGEEFMYTGLVFSGDGRRLHLLRNMSREILQVMTWDATPRRWNPP